MEHQKLINLSENEVTKSYKIRKKNSVEINVDALGNYKINSKIKHNTVMLKSSLTETHTYLWRGQ